MEKIFFGANLLSLRKEKKQTQSDAAIALGLKNTTFSNYEKGITEPDFKTLLNISKFFGINAHDLLFKDLSKAEGMPAKFEAADSNLQELIATQRDLIAMLKEKIAAYEEAAAKKKQ